LTDVFNTCILTLEVSMLQSIETSNVNYHITTE
jgi:hypothetical protein